jgi:hypothetical protein
MRKRRFLAATAATFTMVGIGAGISTAAAHASTTPPAVSATTYIANHPDSGDGGTWAYDDFHRVLTEMQAPASMCTAASFSGFSVPADTCYTAEITDTGRFNAIPGVAYPNISFTGKIANAVSGPMTGSSGYVFYAPSADVPSAANAETYQNDDFATSSNPAQTTPSWYLQMFPASEQDAVVGTESNNWTWTYTDVCGEKWTDAASNGGGDTLAAGNITGDVCVTSQSAVGLISNVNSEKCLDVTSGAYASGGGLQQYTCNSYWDGVKAGDQEFRIITRSNGTSALTAVAPGSTATWYVTSSTQGAQLVLRPYYSAGADMVKSGSFYTFPKTGLVMDVTGRSTANNAVVHGWPKTGATNQQWSLP